MVDKKLDKKFILEFIKVYHGLPALWDVKCKDYTNRVRKREQYDLLIEKYREKYPDANKQDVVNKINSLRTNFRKELKRHRYAKKTGTGAVEPSLWYFEEMRFLQFQETPTHSISTMDTSEDTGSTTLDTVEGNEDSGNAIKTEDAAKNGRPKKKNKKADRNEELVKMTCKRLLLQQPPDDYDKIAAAWAVDLRKMESQQQLFAKKAINDIIFEGQMGTLHRNSVEINATYACTPYSGQSLPPTTLKIEPPPQNKSTYFGNFE